MNIFKRLQRGAAVTTVMGLIAVMSWVMTAVGTAKYGNTVGDSLRIKDRMGSIQTEMKQVFDQAADSGAISEAQAAIMKRRVDRNAALFQKLAERVVQRQGQILHANSAFFTLDIAASAFSRDYKQISDRVASMGRAFRKIDEFDIDSLFKAISGANSVTGELMASSVQMQDIEAELGGIMQVWKQDETPFQKAMVAAKARAFWDHVQEMELSRDQKKAWFKTFVARLSREGWRIPGVDFSDRESVGRYVLAEIRGYRKEQTEQPELEILSLSAAPKVASHGDTVRLSAQVRTKGIPKAHVQAAYVAAGMDVPTRVLSTARSDVAMEVVGDWVVQDHLSPGEYGYELTVNAVDPNSLGDLLGNNRFSASRTGRVRVDSDVQSLEQMLASYQQQMSAKALEVNAACRKARKCSKATCKLPRSRYDEDDRYEHEEYCRLWVENKPGGSRVVHLLDCGCESYADVLKGPFATNLRSDMLANLPGMPGCLQSHLPAVVRQHQACHDQWLREADNAYQADRNKYACLDRLKPTEQSWFDTCLKAACKNACKRKSNEWRYREARDNWCKCQ